MMPLVGAKESEEVVVRRIVRRLERYFEEIEGQQKNKKGVRNEFGLDGGSTATSNQFADDHTPEMQVSGSFESGDDDDLDAPTVRKPPPLPHVKHDPEFPKAPPLPKTPDHPSTPPVPVVTVLSAPVAKESSAESHMPPAPPRLIPEVQSLALVDLDEPEPNPSEPSFADHVEPAPANKPASDAAVSLLFQGRPTPFHKPTKAANVGLVVALVFGAILICLLVLYVLMGPEFRSH